MNLFETVKQVVSVPDAARRYGVEIERRCMARCPFHDDRTPSLKLNPEFFYCFGCGTKGDVVDLVAKLFELTPYEAAKKLAEDFGIEKPPPGVPKGPKHPMISAFREDERRCQRMLCDYLDLLTGWKVRYAPTSPDEEPDDRYAEACQMLDRIEYLADLLTVGTLEQRMAVVNELMNDGRLSGLEDRVDRAKEREEHHG